MENDYRKYHFSIKERVLVWIEGSLIITLFAYLFYDSYWAVLAGSPFLLFYDRWKAAQKAKREREKLLMHFKETILSILSSLRAGLSPENAFREAYSEMKTQFGEQDAMVEELLYINRSISNSIPLEKALMNLAKRSGCEDILDFAEIFVITKRTGGDMGKVIEKTAAMIAMRMETKEEIITLLASKRYEQKIMNLVPLGIIAYINITNPGYFHALYHNLFGIIIMSIIIVIYMFSLWLSGKILEVTAVS